MSDIYQDHYQMLGLRRDATESLIKSSFRKLSLQWHPDKNISGSEQFLKINNAYRVLIDPKKRASYDHSTLKTKSQSHVHPSEDFIVSDIMARRDRYYLSKGNFEQPNRFFPIPNPGEPNQDDFYKKLKVAICIGGVLLAYVTYKIYRGYHPPMPVPEAVITQVVPQEFTSKNAVVKGVRTGWNWTASNTGPYLVSPLKNIFNAVWDRVVPPK
ncbi:chaperone protein DnaJ [Drosophila rhopaloa]|uniref:DnaJ homolog subfamily B member 9 n=1 Tax=Drosophila rhopaloa TaxID=1041015 RepID=A0ABM5J104_DRORH|nr:chaperone protein DnaJ [Drosophila rhopaloa]